MQNIQGNYSMLFRQRIIDRPAIADIRAHIPWGRSQPTVIVRKRETKK